jgi:hypothetical protein
VTTERMATRAGKFFSHQELWYDLQDILRLLEADEQPRRGLFSAAIVMTYACLEAHTNFLGEQLFPSVWAEEKSKAASSPIRGTLAKLDFLSTALKVEFDRARALHSTLKALKRRRDQFAHPRIETRSHRVTVAEANRLRPIQSEYGRLLTQSFVHRAVQAVIETADKLQAAAHQQYPHKILGPHAFVGISGVGGISLDP